MVPILILQGDAEARLLAGAPELLPAAFPQAGLRVSTAWSTRSELLLPGAPGLPRAVAARGLVPGIPARELLEQSWKLVIFSLLPDAALPLLRWNGDGALVAHRAVREGWSPVDAAWVEAESRAEELGDPAASARELEAVIEPLQQRGAVVAVTTVFRHVLAGLEHRRGPGPASLRERIRQTNLEATRLSHRTGCFVLDLDRALAHEGGAALQADCFGGSGRAQELALDELLALLLEAIPDELQALEVA